MRILWRNFYNSWCSSCSFCTSTVFFQESLTTIFFLYKKSPKYGPTLLSSYLQPSKPSNFCKMILILGNCFSSSCAWLLLFSFVRSRSDTIVKKELRSENRKKRNSCTSDDEEIQNTSVVKQYPNKIFWKILKNSNFQTLAVTTFDVQ